MRRLTQGTERRGRGALRVTALLTLLTALLVVPATAGAAFNGGLKQLAGTAGCLSGAATPPAGCGAVRGLGTDTGVAVITKDGRSVYVASRGKDAIVAFDRNTTTGRLTQKSSVTGCFTTDPNVAAPNPDGCNPVTGDTGALDEVEGLALSAGGTSLYATTQTGRLSTFKRASDGTLTFVNSFALGGGSGSNALPAVAVSPDSKTVYVAGPGGYGGILRIFPRDTSGTASHGNLSFFDCIGVTVCARQVPNMQSTISELAVTPDSKQVILASGEGNAAVIGFDRSTTDGDLNAATAATAARCISGFAQANCTQRSGQDYPRGISIASNRDIYVAGYYALTTIQRNPSTNALSAPASSEFCNAYSGSGFSGCVEQRTCDVMCGGRAIFAGPDGKNVYRGSENGAVLTFARNSANGAFSANPTALGCLTSAAVTGCTTLRQGTGVRTLVGDSTNRNVYAVGNGRVFSFAVDHAPVCQNVAAGTTNTASVIVGLSCSDPDGDAVTYEKVTDPARGTLAGIQGNAVSYGPQPGTTGVDSFQYRAVAAGVPSDPATASINVTAPPTGGGGGGGGGGAVTTVPSTTSISSLGFKKYTKLLALSVKNLVAGSTVRVTCKTKKKSRQKKGCAYKSRRFTTSGARAQAQPAQAVREEADPGRHEDHDHDHRARLPREAGPVHDPRGQDPAVARALPLGQRQGRQLRLSCGTAKGRRSHGSDALS